MNKKEAVFLQYKSELKANFSKAFTDSLEKMGNQAEKIDWFAGNGVWQK